MTKEMTEDEEKTMSAKTITMKKRRELANQQGLQTVVYVNFIKFIKEVAPMLLHHKDHYASIAFHAHDISSGKIVDKDGEFENAVNSYFLELVPFVETEDLTPFVEEPLCGLATWLKLDELWDLEAMNPSLITEESEPNAKERKIKKKNAVRNIKHFWKHVKQCVQISQMKRLVPEKAVRRVQDTVLDYAKKNMKKDPEFINRIKKMATEGVSTGGGVMNSLKNMGSLLKNVAKPELLAELFGNSSELIESISENSEEYAKILNIDIPMLEDGGDEDEYSSEMESILEGMVGADGLAALKASTEKMGLGPGGDNDVTQISKKISL